MLSCFLEPLTPLCGTQFEKHWATLMTEVASHFVELRSFTELRAELHWAESDLHNTRRGGQTYSLATWFHPSLLELVMKGWNSIFKMVGHERLKFWKLWLKSETTVCACCRRNCCLLTEMYICCVLLHCNVHGISCYIMQHLQHWRFPQHDMEDSGLQVCFAV
jgi:hypothetical protein